MKTLLLRTISFLLIGASCLHAQVLIDDTFSRDGNLNGSTPTSELGTGQWTSTTSTSVYTTSASTSSLSLVDSSTTTMGNGNYGNTAYIAILSAYLTGGSLKSGFNYQLTVTADITGGMYNGTINGGILGVGFGNFSSTAGPVASPDTLGPTMIDWAQAPQQVGAYFGKNAADPTPTVDVSGTITLTIDLNTTGTYWTVEAFENGVPVPYTDGSDIFTYSTPGNPFGTSIDAVGLWNYRGIDATLTDFELSVPEPSIWSMLGLGLFALGWRLFLQSASRKAA